MPLTLTQHNTTQRSLPRALTLHSPQTFNQYSVTHSQVTAQNSSPPMDLNNGSSHNAPSSASEAYWHLLLSLSHIPLSHYFLAFALLLFSFLYNFLQLHFFHDLFSGFPGSPVAFTYHPSSQIYQSVVSKCRVLRGRYFPTPWLSGPHLQTLFLNFFGRPPRFNYTRQLLNTTDGGTIALDWLLSSDISGGASRTNGNVSKDDSTPIVVAIPGLTSDSSSAYLKHLAYHTAKRGWNVVVCNHRGIGGVSITSDCFYNAGRTEDIRTVVNYLHKENPRAPLFVVGTSIGANILIKYLGEDRENTPVAGGVAICSPWDLLITDRFISRRRAQRIYDKAIAVGLQDYAKLHQPRFSRLANWEMIEKSVSIRDFDNHWSRIAAKYETVDTYYRHSSSSIYVQSVSIPLLCISALDDPICTEEAIPWDECRLNKNIVLATLEHGGHLAFFEGITASNLWWVRATNEFLDVLHASNFMHVQKEISKPNTPLVSSIDQGPYVHVTEDGTVAALNNEQATDNVEEKVDKKDELGKLFHNNNLFNENITGKKKEL